MILHDLFPKSVIPMNRIAIQTAHTQKTDKDTA